MGKSEGRKESQPTLISDDESGEEGEAKGPPFFSCYLLTSLSPRFKGHTYIGFTVNPRRRIRQHNGEIVSGAWRTKKKRPWEMVLCIYGFPTNVAALQFEWAWQHPSESLAVRQAAASFKSLTGLANKIKLAYTMLTLPPWQSLNLTVNLFSTKYQIHTSGCPALPDEMRARVSSMDELPCYNLIFGEWDNDHHNCEWSCEKNVSQKTNYNREHCGGENQGPAFICETAVKPLVGSPRKKRSAASQDDKEEKRASNGQVDIIDVFTPSPCREVDSGSKKRRRRMNVGSEIIDLTTSPLFVG
ncbi:structure-specific endonuclease subunit SLX1 homolog [Striga asiatica]|uniref:Structure-specific endonuclease subunit SLX1 homolog n=1 Tax=Striga asiatica TaxID=4170 RepID=A0A5A7QZ17_STRAF|nr:structure-specific endonuclease subunit SLX1 homolog [Striga asiatica]